MLQCYDDFKTIDVTLTRNELNIFYNLQALSSHEVAGALVFNKYGRLQKYNAFLGGNDHITWGHGHIIGYHTHPVKSYIRNYAPPSYIDYVNKIQPTISVYKKYKVNPVGIVFDSKGTWTFRLTPQLIKKLLKIKNKQKIKCVKKIIKNNTRILNIQLSQPQYIVKFKTNKGHFPKIGLHKYLHKMKYILNPNKPKSNLGFIVTFTPKGRKVIIPNVKQCTETLKSLSRIYNIPPKTELKLLKTKYVTPKSKKSKKKQ